MPFAVGLSFPGTTPHSPCPDLAPRFHFQTHRFWEFSLLPGPVLQESMVGFYFLEVLQDFQQVRSSSWNFTDADTLVKCLIFCCWLSPDPKIQLFPLISILLILAESTELHLVSSCLPTAPNLYFSTKTQSNSSFSCQFTEFSYPRCQGS